MMTSDEYANIVTDSIGDMNTDDGKYPEWSPRHPLSDDAQIERMESDGRPIYGGNL